MPTNYLLGFGERLMTKLDTPKVDPNKWHPYSFEKAKKRAVAKLRAIGREVTSLAEKFRPAGEAVSLLTLHPTYLAKSYYPSHFLAECNLRSIGSRARMILPEIQRKSANGKPELANEFFLAGSSSQLAQLHATVESWYETSLAADDVVKIEDIRMPNYAAKIQLADYHDDTCTYWEAVLHAPASRPVIVDSFARLIREMGGSAEIDRRVHASGLCFVPVRIDFDSLKEATPFQFLRVVRGMPRLRTIKRQVGSPLTFDCDLPTEPAIERSIRAMICDGGPVVVEGTGRWVTNSQPEGLGPSVDDYRDHAIGVASATLFGPIEKGKPLPRPYCNVEVVRVLDEKTAADGPDYFDVLKRIVDAVKSRTPDFLNLSIGPDIPVEDDEPHLWTSTLDPLFFDKRILAFTAVGNNGEKDWESGNARVQAPSDCVNAVSVGSCNSLRDDWKRSLHSSIGPGRSPGYVNPSFLALGGEHNNPYFVLGPATGTAVPVLGTSYASPTAMRVAAGIRAYLGPTMGALAIEALMINRADPRGDRSIREVGWGRICHRPEELISSDDSTAHIIFQDDLEAGQWMRVPIPIPSQALPGKVYITATFVYKTPTDPEHPASYTRAGLRLRFRPHEDRREEETQQRPNSKSIASKRRVLGKTEQDWRLKSFEWEPALHLHYSPNGKDIKAPAFEIHYNARKGADGDRAAGPIPFALVVTVRSRKVKDLYNQIASQYRTILQALRPIHLPVPLPASKPPSRRPPSPDDEEDE